MGVNPILMYFLSLLTVLCVLISGCKQADLPPAPSTAEEQPLAESISSPSAQEEDTPLNDGPLEKENPAEQPGEDSPTDVTFATLMEEVGEENMVLLQGYDGKTEKLEIFEEWLAAWQAGEPATAYILMQGMGRSIYILNSEGNPDYTVTTVREDSYHGETFHSTAVLDRPTGYVLMPDYRHGENYPVLLSKTGGNHDYEKRDWDGTPLGTCSPEQAAALAKECEAQLYDYLEARHAATGGYNLSAAGVYFGPQHLERDTADDFATHGKEVEYVVMEIINIRGIDCYSLWGYPVDGSHEIGEYTGYHMLVSGDGTVFFEADQAHGGYILLRDDNSTTLTAGQQ